jgi:hypothetical protein
VVATAVSVPLSASMCVNKHSGHTHTTSAVKTGVEVVVLVRAVSVDPAEAVSTALMCVQECTTESNHRIGQQLEAPLTEALCLPMTRRKSAVLIYTAC